MDTILDRLWRPMRLLVNTLTCLFLVGPMVIIIIISFSSARYLTFPPPGFSLEWYVRLFGDPRWGAAFVTSVKVMIPSGLVATALGVAAAFGLSRSKSFALRFFSSLILAPLMVPGIVAAAGIYMIFRPLQLSGTVTGLVLAHIVLTIPFVVATVLPALRLLDPQQLPAAYTLGATPRVAFVRVILPQIAPAVISALLFSMIVSFDELVVSLFLSSASLQTVTVRMYSDLMGSIDPTISAIGTLIFLFSLAVLLVNELIVAAKRPKSTAIAR